MKSSFLLLSFVFILTFVSKAQFPLRINSRLTPEFLIQKILVEENNALQISNVTFLGHPDAIGAFSNSSKYYLMKKGIILSTGMAERAIGPNQYSDMGTAMGVPGNELLDAIGTGRTYDACRLSFDFHSERDSIKFNFIFASEEYPEYVHKGVNDIFAFFIEDLESGVNSNLAVFGKESTPVNVDNINHIKNSDLYIENGKWDPDNVIQWKENPGLGELAMTYEFDGFTTIMSAGHKIVPGRKYRISFIIADVGDRIYDSAVFLEASSFVSLSSDKKEDELMVELNREFSEPSLSFEQNGDIIIMKMMVHFDFDDHTIRADSSLRIMEKLSRFLRIHNDLNVRVYGHTDNIGEEEYNILLSEKRAKSASDMLVSHGIESSRINSAGFGDTKPIADNVTEKSRLKNRRIEFELYR